MQELVERIRALEDRLQEEFQNNRELYQYKLRGKIAEFAEEMVVRHRALRIKWPQYVLKAQLLNILVAPVIYVLVVPILILDLSVTLYQHICFRAYGIPLVTRSNFIVFDRHRLAYLNIIEKINCSYCSYGNGVFAYAREIAGRTEQFWCPIKHALRIRDPQHRYAKFLEYGDAEGYRSCLAEQRQDVRNSDEPHIIKGEHHDI